MATETFAYVQSWQRKLDAGGWWHSFDLPNGQHIEGVSPVSDLTERLGQFPIPDDLRGARVLDIGAWDGWFSFEMERRGADVLAIDCWDNPRFRQIRGALKSHVEYRQMDVYDLTPETVGRFDIVLFMGVLYHLKHPLLALERVCALATEMAAVDSFVLQERHRPGEEVENRPIMEFYETDEFGGQRDNWCGPSLPCLMALCRTAGFARVEHRATLTNGACIACYRKWEPVSASSGPSLELLEAYHHTNFGINFNSKHDEYLTVFFRGEPLELTVDQVKPEVAAYGVRPYYLQKRDSGVWQTNFKLPPGITPGWHDLTIRVDGSISNPKRIAVDIPVPASAIHINGVRDGATWEEQAVDLGRGNVLSAWLTGLPANADRANVFVSLGGERLPVNFVGPEAENGERQINCEIPGDAPGGDFEFEILHGPSRSNPVPIRVICWP
jgi:tRNA (mo5U34)-methyltransferase